MLARLVVVPAPAGPRRLADIAAAMLSAMPRAVPTLHDPAERRLLQTCESALAELIGEPGDRLLHWDLHYDNILAGRREPWLAIDPKPLGGDPGFELLPALHNRWDALVATGDVPRAVLVRPAHGGTQSGPAARHRLDAGPCAAERPVGHSGRRNRSRPGAGRHRHGAARPLTSLQYRVRLPWRLA